MMMPLRFLVIGALVAIALGPQSAYADEMTEAEQQFAVGQSAFDGKQYGDAITAWERSYALSNEPALLFNIAQAYRLRARPGDCAKASEGYRKFISLDASSAQRPEAEGFITGLKDCVAREAPKSTAPTSVSVSTGAHNTAPTLPAQRENRGGPKKIAGIATAGTGVALIATGFYFGHRATSIGDEVTRACATGCDWGVYGPKDADGQSALTKQYVFDGIGAAAIVAGGILYWLGTREPTTSTVAITSHRDGAAITWSGSW